MLQAAATGNIQRMGIAFRTTPCWHCRAFMAQSTFRTKFEGCGRHRQVNLVPSNLVSRTSAALLLA